MKATWAQCADGHRIRLEVRVETEERLQPIPCPTCERRTIVFTGDVLAVLPGEWFAINWRGGYQSL